ncbi:DNA polymerase III subunit delta' [Zobellella maritima]|uniref:DNA polymerase III subunit delta' n=1 Tax=Zobellella maritima TaxID=2059725 RepID=UPI000E303375|nr:DNA polymerase III subunit delta' [Zobellella maritima]
MYPWLVPSYQRLQLQLRQGRLAHALLLSGIQGMGKQLLAHHLVKTILCQHANMAPCEQCHACKLHRAGNHPDYHVFNGQDNKIGVDAIRSLGRIVAESARLGGPKAVLIEHADNMTEAAANALLKTLEEPAGKTYLILTSHQPERLLPTIRSRCQQWALGLPAAAQVLSWLAEQGHEANTAILNINQGSPLQCRDYLASGTDSQRLGLLQDFVTLSAHPQRLSQLQSALLAQPVTLHWLHFLLQDALQLAQGLSHWLRMEDCRELSRQLSDRGSHRLLVAITGLRRLEQALTLPTGRPLNRSLQLGQWLNQWIMKGEKCAG